MKVGFIGIGEMGDGMARNLLRAGFELRVWDREPHRVEALRAAGAEAAASPAEAAQGAVIVSMLAHDDAIRATFVDSGWMDAATRPLVHVNCSTASVAFARELAIRHREAGIGYVAAPVFGRPDAAAAAQLNMVVAGDPAVVAEIAPVLDALGKKTWHIGSDPHQANLVKIAGNLMIASAIEAMAEASALGAAYGIDRTAMLDLYLDALFPSPVYKGYAAMIKRRSFEPAGFKLRLGLKDVRLALEAGHDADVPLPFGSVLRDVLIGAAATGHAEQDWASLSEVAMQNSGQS